MSDNKNPVEGDTFECEECGMQILITADCQCESGGPFFSCCDSQMSAAGSKAE
ncbi:hypothetical protein OAM69_05005 [bacterium]|nr:hypothetical protein [bacterium]